ncbi:FHA domain containing protein [Nitzschia inconspicua]|uniref:FHA domain containing protein n=1 Tax=Nitzschia inconspicua TaxID=303405 RepID=A0A9K3Q6R4_9STRA|nr:FHA domain containing protein [Nitzschia inconspicua]
MSCSADTTFFEGIPKDATPQCPSPFPSAYLVLVPTTTTTSSMEKTSNESTTKTSSTTTNKIEIGHSSQVVPNRNALVVGRQAANSDIRITHKSLSRQHALLYYYYDNNNKSSSSSSNDNDDNDDKDIPSLFVLDLDTKTGTFVNQQKIDSKIPVRLKNGDTIQFGKAQPSFTIQWMNHQHHHNHPKEGFIAETEKEQQQQQQTMSTLDPSLEGLTGRERRQAEIAAMMATLDETPTYTKYIPTAQQQQQQDTTATNKSKRLSSDQRMFHKLVERHHLPLTDSTDMFVLEESHHSISAMVMDPTGARFAIGSMDSSLKLYDFAGFNPVDPIPFQNVIIEDGYPIRNIAYSSTGDRLLIATGSAQPYVVDRDGHELLKFVRGDVYVTDPSKTTGHTAAVTSVGWHPLEKSIVFTTSRDGSLRSWNVDKGKLSFDMLTCTDVIVVKHLQTGRKTIPTCMAVTSTSIAIGTQCGSLQIYNYPFVSKLRPQQSVQVVVVVGPSTKDSTVDDESVLSLVYSVDASKIAVRTKNHVTVWNIGAGSKLSSSSSPWMIIDNVHLDDSLADDNNTPTMAFSPNGKLLCVAVSQRRSTTTSGNDDDTSSKSLVNNTLQLYSIPKETKKDNNKPANPIYSLPIGDNNGNPLTVAISGLVWHVKLNQILITTPHNFQIWYSTDWSKKGILLTIGRRYNRKRHAAEQDLQDLYVSRAPPPGSAVREEHIIAPNALPLFAGDQQRNKKKSKKHRAEEEHEQAMAKRIPQKPAKGVYDTANTMFTQMIMDTQTSDKIQMAGMDPREALAKYSEGKSYIGVAYQGNVERILTEKTVEEEEEEMKQGKRK